MAVLTTIRHRFWDNAGNLAAGGKVYVYEPGTTTPKDSYTDSTGATPNAWPVILDAKGEAAIWTSGMFKLNVTDSLDVQITGYPVDNLGYDITAASFATSIHNATAKNPPIAADEFGIWDSVTGLLRKLTFGNLKTEVLTGNAASSTVSNRVDSGIVTIASSATTSDIFAAAANTINWTGTATTTAFPAASKAGMERKLICADACLFTSSADLEIEGIPIGNTITLAADAIVIVTAETTTHFKLTYSLSGTFTATGTGFTVNPTTTAKYRITNGFANISIPYVALTGTSNSTGFTITGMPACLAPITQKMITLGLAVDNSIAITNLNASITAASTTITLRIGDSALWTAAGTKTLSATEISYSIA